MSNAGRVTTTEQARASRAYAALAPCLRLGASFAINSGDWRVQKKDGL